MTQAIRTITIDPVIEALNEAKQLILFTMSTDSIPSQRLARAVAMIEQIQGGLGVGRYDRVYPNPEREAA